MAAKQGFWAGEDAASSVPCATTLLDEATSSRSKQLFGAFHLGVACFIAQGKALKLLMVLALHLRNSGASSAGAP